MSFRICYVAIIGYFHCRYISSISSKRPTWPLVASSLEIHPSYRRWCRAWGINYSSINLQSGMSISQYCSNSDQYYTAADSYKHLIPPMKRMWGSHSTIFKRINYSIYIYPNCTSLKNLLVLVTENISSKHPEHFWVNKLVSQRLLHWYLTKCKANQLYNCSFYLHSKYNSFSIFIVLPSRWTTYISNTDKVVIMQCSSLSIKRIKIYVMKWKKL